MTCEEFVAMKETVTSDTPASMVVAAWQHYCSCQNCRVIAKKKWDETDQTIKDLVRTNAPSIALYLAIRVANDPEIGESR